MTATKDIPDLSENFPGSKPPAEQILILECARAAMSPAQITRVKAILKAGLDWDFIINTSFKNGVLPLISANLLQTFEDHLPPEIKEKLALQFQEHTQHNLFLTAKLLEIVRTLADAGIPVLPFKGPVLAMRAFGNLALRQFVDLDILVQPKHFDAAVQKITESGYRAVSQVPWLKRKALFFARRKDIGLVSDDLKARIELHWKLSGSHFALPLELNQLWERLEEINLGGAKVKTPAFTDLFVYLCLHGSRHGWERLAWICDIHELIRSEQKNGVEIDWHLIRLHAQKHGCEKVVELGLFLVEEFFGVRTNFPGWSQIEKNETFRKISRQIRHRVFVKNQTPTEIGDWYLYHLSLKEKRTDKFKLHVHYFFWYLRLVLTPNSLDKAVFNLPGIFYPLYYILRPSRLLYTYFSLDNGKKKTTL
jgi:hypothetical protein